MDFKDCIEFIYLVTLLPNINIVTGEFPAQKASNAEKFPFGDLIMKHVVYASAMAQHSWNNCWWKSISFCIKSIYINFIWY